MCNLQMFVAQLCKQDFNMDFIFNNKKKLEYATKSYLQKLRIIGASSQVYIFQEHYGHYLALLHCNCIKGRTFLPYLRTPSPLINAHD